MTDTAPVRYIEAITRRYRKLGYDPYRWFEADRAPALAMLPRPLAQCRLGMLATSGTYAAGQVAYHYKDDTSLRAIPKTTPVEDLRFAHITENYLEDSRRDPNCTFPIDALRSLESAGRIGELAGDLLSCMGGIYSQRRVREELIPAVEERFRRQRVDAALLVPM
jgi:D-proline reductase (dithiol) PrdB